MISSGINGGAERGASTGGRGQTAAERVAGASVNMMHCVGAAAPAAVLLGRRTTLDHEQPGRRARGEGNGGDAAGRAQACV